MTSDIVQAWFIIVFAGMIALFILDFNQTRKVKERYPKNFQEGNPLIRSKHGTVNWILRWGFCVGALVVSLWFWFGFSPYHYRNEACVALTIGAVVYTVLIYRYTKKYLG